MTGIPMDHSDQQGLLQAQQAQNPRCRSDPRPRFDPRYVSEKEVTSHYLVVSEVAHLKGIYGIYAHNHHNPDEIGPPSSRCHVRPLLPTPASNQSSSSSNHRHRRKMMRFASKGQV